LATLLLSAHSQNLGVIFCGAAAALISTSFIGVWAGAWVARVIPPPAGSKPRQAWGSS
jgi:putative Ca2+/H+ antiporter (TMEM165/GDT1 family)